MKHAGRGNLAVKGNPGRIVRNTFSGDDVAVIELRARLLAIDLHRQDNACAA